MKRSDSLPNRQRLLWVASAALLVCQPARCTGQAGESPNALLRIIESVDVPALSTGGLASVAVREGDLVQEGQVVAEVDSRRASFALQQTKAELEIARKKSVDDIDVRYAMKSHQIAVAELKRSESINAEIAGIVTAREIDRLILAVERTSLEIERSSNNRENAKLELQKTKADLSLAEHTVAEHRIESPLDGMVVHVFKQRGEWVEAGDSVVQIVRIDRLRAEGFLHANDVAGDLVGRSAVVDVQLSADAPRRAHGKIVFVSPEADPVNSQVRIWAEIDNAKGLFRPGLRGHLKILDAAAERDEIGLGTEIDQVPAAAAASE